MKNLKDLKDRLEQEGFYVEPGLDSIEVYNEKPESYTTQYESTGLMLRDMYRDIQKCSDPMCLPIDDPVNKTVGFVVFEVSEPNAKKWSYSITPEALQGSRHYSYLETRSKRSSLSKAFCQLTTYFSYESVLESL